MFACFPGQYFIPIHAASSGGWEPGGEMALGRSRHTATLLPDGTVLVAGGYTGVLSSPMSTSTAEIYDPFSAAWQPAPSMADARSRHSATLLADGRVLVAGGRDNNGLATASTEIYDPLTRTWSATGNLQVARMDHTATLLDDGRVLVAGGQSQAAGYGNLAEKSVETYDPATGLWSIGKSMANARYGHTAKKLPSGKVLVAGGAGHSGDSVYSFRAEIFDPFTNEWNNVDSLTKARGFHSALILEQGDLIVAGGFTLPANSLVTTNSTEIYDIAYRRWTPTGNLNIARNAGESGAVLLASGCALIAGGRTNTAETYDPSTGQWSMTGSMSTVRNRHVLTLLYDGRVLATGGENRDGFVSSAELYFP